MTVFQFQNDVAAGPLLATLHQRLRAGPRREQVPVVRADPTVNADDDEQPHVVQLLWPHRRKYRGLNQRCTLQHRANASLVLPQLVELRVILVFFF